MNKNEECEVVKDLSSLYIENMISESSKNFIDNHLMGCKTCEKYYKDLKSTFLNEDKKEKKLFAAMLDILDELVEAVDDLDEELDEMQEYVESIDEDLEDAEELLDIIDEDLDLVEEMLGIEDEDFGCTCGSDCDDCDCEDDCDECECDCDCEFEDDYEDDEIIEVECPECGETVCFFDTMLDEEEEAEVVEILCPKCDAVVYTFERDLIIEDEEEDEE